MTDPNPVNRSYGGGDVNLQAGKASIPPRDAGDCESAKDGSITFSDANGLVLIRLDSGGKNYIRGTEVADDAEVYAAFRHWLIIAGVLKK